MSEAEIQGETHLSRKDKQTLMQLDLSCFDAVFREGHNADYFERDLTVGYTLFAIGNLLYGATYGRVYTSSEDFEDKVEASDIPFYKVDAEIYETYEMVPRWKRILILLIAPFFSLIILGLFLSPFNWAVGYLGLTLPYWVSFIGAILFVLFFGLAWPLGYFLLLEGEVMSDRDQYMSDEILRISSENGYENVLMSCGDGHRRGISDALEDADWSVEEHPTENWLGRVLLLKDRVVAAVLNPKTTFSRLRHIFSSR